MRTPRLIVDAYIMPIVNATINRKRHSDSLADDGGDDTKTLLEYLVTLTEGEW